MEAISLPIEFFLKTSNLFSFVSNSENLIIDVK